MLSYLSSPQVLCALSLLTGLFFLFNIWMSIRTKKQNQTLIKTLEEKNKEIASQKAMVEEKNRAILSSIEYAKNIQEAILTSESYLKSIIDDFFIFYKPRDIIGGDFYWGYKTQENDIIIAVADCTGHGVPGALMSMIGNALLNEIVIENGITSPALIAEQLRAGIINSFKHSDVEEKNTTHDGMDISLIKLNLSTRLLSYTAANQPLYVISNNTIIKTKVNDFSISSLNLELKHFEEHEVQLKKSDCIFLSTDGFQDQFGGEKGKKFKLEPFRKLLLKLSKLNSEEQKRTLDTTLKNWVSSQTPQHPQIDDICILGIRV